MEVVVMSLRKLILALCILLTALCGTAFAASDQAALNHCMTLCNMNTQVIKINNPYPGLNVPMNNMSYYTNTIKPAMKGLGSVGNCGEGGCTFSASAPVDCSTAKNALGRCNFPNTNGFLRTPININWVY
jgi:hypothetical protein